MSWVLKEATYRGEESSVLLQKRLACQSFATERGNHRPWMTPPLGLMGGLGVPGFQPSTVLGVSACSLLLLFPERTLMLPLTEGSLRLRADDEDSLTSEDSFFSATEVTGGRDQAWGGVKAAPLQAHGASTGSWETGGIFSDRSRIWTLSRASSKLLGMGGAEKSGAVVL